MGSVGSELQRGRNEEGTMDSVFAKDAVETPEPVKAAVSGEFVRLSINLGLFLMFVPFTHVVQ